MARLQLSKSALARERKNLRTFERFLPSLDLKRQQLMAERGKAVKRVARLRAEIDGFRADIGQRIPMLAHEEVDLTDLVRVCGVDEDEENLVGTRLPRLLQVKFELQEYSLLAKPLWVDAVVDALRHMLEARVRIRIEEVRLDALEQALKTITQRVNLFDKVLIPKARANMKRIQIYLSDMETAAVVRSKIAKRKRAAAEVA